MDLEQRVLELIAHGTLSEMNPILEECIDQGGIKGLALVQRMFEDMYGGMTFNSEFKLLAASCLLAWGPQGVTALAESALRKPEYKNILLALQVLASIAAGDLVRSQYGMGPPDSLRSRILSRMTQTQEIVIEAKARLNEIVLSFSDDDDAAQYVGAAIQGFFTRADAAKQLFKALSTRWATISTPVLRQYAELIETRSNHEPSFQTFFEQHPQLLDPMALEVWPQPNFHGYKKPDFMVRRSDDTYIVIEIEVPGKALVTDGLQISSQTTHAAGQVMEYRSFLMERFREATDHFPRFREPDGLVIVGLEDALSLEQRAVLRRENQHRSGLQIVGFDWIKNRAEAIMRNLIHAETPLRVLRMV